LENITVPTSSESNERRNGIGLLPAFDFFLRSVARCIGRRVAADAIGHGLEQHRPPSLRKNLPLAAERVDHRQRVVAVHALGVHLFRIDARTEPRDVLHAHRLAHGLAAHAVEIVHAVEDDRQPAAERRIPERAVLIHCREGDAFPHGSAAE
jgi:hypothetical protein